MEGSEDWNKPPRSPIRRLATARTRVRDTRATSACRECCSYMLPPCWRTASRCVPGARQCAPRHRPCQHAGLVEKPPKRRVGSTQACASTSNSSPALPGNGHPRVGAVGTAVPTTDRGAEVRAQRRVHGAAPRERALDRALEDPDRRTTLGRSAPSVPLARRHRVGNAPRAPEPKRVTVVPPNRTPTPAVSPVSGAPGDIASATRWGAARG